MSAPLTVIVSDLVLLRRCAAGPVLALALGAVLAPGCSEQRPVGDLAAELPGADVQRRSELVKELAARGSEAVPVWIGLLPSKDDDLHLKAAAELGSLGPAAAEAVPALITVLRNGRYRPWRWEELSVAERGQEDAGRTPSRRALAQIGAPAIPALRSLLLDAGAAGRARLEAALTLGEIGPPATLAQPDLLTALAARDKAIASAAAWALGRIGSDDPVVLDALGRALEDEESALRYQAVGAIAALGPDARSLRAAVRARLADPDPQVALEAERALALIGTDAGEPQERAPEGAGDEQVPEQRSGGK